LAGVPFELLDDKEFAKKYLAEYDELYKSLSKKLRDDEELFLMCPNKEVLICYTSERLYAKFSSKKKVQ
jgi:hypothetical protein